MICAHCGDLITVDDFGFAHSHHDLVGCDWLPPLRISEFENDDDYVDRANELLAVHEETCEKLLYYHNQCCRRCSGDLVGV